jgi:hypothetical protein
MTPALIAALALAAAPAAAPASSKPHAHKPVVVEPKWESVPNGDDFADAYPAAAVGAQVEGAVKLKCKVHLDGSLFDCAPVTETPEGWGFGQASLTLVPHFKMRPKTVDGVPVDGAPVQFSVNWKLPEISETAGAGPPPPTIAEAEARDPEALALARKVATLTASLDDFSLAVQSVYPGLYVRLFGTAEPDRSAAFGKSFNAAFADYDAERHDRLAASMVFTYSREELKAIKDFLETPAGSAFVNKFREALAKSNQQGRDLWGAFVDAWQSRYCAEIACKDSELAGFQKLRDGFFNSRAASPPPPPAASQPAKDGKGG